MDLVLDLASRQTDSSLGPSVLASSCSSDTGLAPMLASCSSFSYLSPPACGSSGLARKQPLLAQPGLQVPVEVHWPLACC